VEKRHDAAAPDVSQRGNESKGTRPHGRHEPQKVPKKRRGRYDENSKQRRIETKCSRKSTW